MALESVIHVYISLTTLDAELARKMEPRTSTPAARLEAIRKLADAGVPVGVMTAPIIPGLNDRELPALLSAARDAGAQSAGYVLLRLPYAVRPIFEDWLMRHCPLQAERVLSLIRTTRDGKLNGAEFGGRMRGAGSYADTIAATFKAFKQKLGFARHLPEMDATRFHPPRNAAGQRTLF
jgi:DNA repair photolyase